MATYVITVIGDDRVGLVQSLADAVSAAGGNWERSELAELVGKFAGLVVVTVPDDRTDDLAAGLRALDGMLEVHLHEAGTPTATTDDTLTVTLDLVGNDRPGIVQEITSAVKAHGVSIDRFESEVTDAPMGAGTLFSCHATLRGEEAAFPLVRADLERLADELMVDLTLGEDAA